MSQKQIVLQYLLYTIFLFFSTFDLFSCVSVSVYFLFLFWSLNKSKKKTPHYSCSVARSVPLCFIHTHHDMMEIFPHFSAVFFVVACSGSYRASIFSGINSNDRRRTTWFSALLCCSSCCNEAWSSPCIKYCRPTITDVYCCIRVFPAAVKSHHCLPWSPSNNHSAPTRQHHLRWEP